MWTSWTCPKCEKTNVEEITLPQPPKIVECEHCSERHVMFVTIEVKTELYPYIEASRSIYFEQPLTTMSKQDEEVEK